MRVFCALCRTVNLTVLMRCSERQHRENFRSLSSISCAQNVDALSVFCVIRRARDEQGTADMATIVTYAEYVELAASDVLALSLSHQLHSNIFLIA